MEDEWWLKSTPLLEKELAVLQKENNNALNEAILAKDTDQYGEKLTGYNKIFDKNYGDIERIERELEDRKWIKTAKCIHCDKPAEWFLFTQFSGSIPFCKEHAEQEVSFDKDDSYGFWISKEKSIKRVNGKF